MLKNFSIAGDSDDFSFEHRLFNNLCAFSILACIFAFTANWIIGLSWKLQTTIGVLFVFFIYLYYLSRLKKIYKRVIIPYHIAVVVFLSLMWFLNGGINGPMGFYYFIALLGILIFLRSFWFAILLVVSCFTIVVVIDYYFHDWVIPYPNSLYRYIDTVVGMATVSLLLGLEIYIIKKTYDAEHTKVNAQKQALAHINDVQNKLISVISHDVRAPFNSLKGTLLLLKSDALTKDEIKMLAGNLSQEVDNTLSLVNNLLYWTQSQLQGINPNPTPFDVTAIIMETVRLVKPQAEKKLISLHHQTIFEKITVNADQEMIKTVLRNLLTNAIKFSFEGGEISVHLQPTHQELIIGIIDNGIGLSPEQQESIFRPTQKTTLGTANEKGNGIGLTLCKDFVEKNGGHIWVESNQGKGSSFYFTVKTF